MTKYIFKEEIFESINHLKYQEDLFYLRNANYLYAEKRREQ